MFYCIIGKKVPYMQWYECHVHGNFAIKSVIVSVERVDMLYCNFVDEVHLCYGADAMCFGAFLLWIFAFSIF